MALVDVLVQVLLEQDMMMARPSHKDSQAHRHYSETVNQPLTKWNQGYLMQDDTSIWRIVVALLLTS
jgi:hypothetical protein